MSNETRAQRLRLLVVAGLLAPGIMALVGLAVAWLFRRPLPDLGAGLTPAGLGIGVVAAVASMGLVSLLYRIDPRLERALRRTGMKVGLEALEVAGYPVMLVVVTAAAFGEELLFRGGLQPVVGLFPAAILFGFSHGGWRPEMWAYALAASLSGLIFGAVYSFTGNIWVPIVAHSVHNVSSTVLMGKKVDITWDGLVPRIRLLPEPLEEEVPEWTPLETDTMEERAADVDEPLPPEGDSEAVGPDDGDSADRPPQ